MGGVMKKGVGRQIGVTAGFVGVLLLNWLANAIPIGGRTVGEVSDRYGSPFTPDDRTFAIWAVIYTGLLAYVIYQALPAQRDDEELQAIAGPFIVSSLANMGWILAWQYEVIDLSMVFMLVILGCLVVIHRRLGIVNPNASWLRKLVVHLPFSLYVGWITVATLANISSVQAAHGWLDAGMSVTAWTLVKLAVAGAIGATVVLRRGDVAFGLVVVWAAWGIWRNTGGALQVHGAAMAVAVTMALVATFEGVRRLLGERPVNR